MINFLKMKKKRKRSRKGAVIQVIRDMTVGGKLALALAFLWLFGLAACGGGGCLPGCGAKEPAPVPAANPPPPSRLVQVTLQKDGIEMPHVMPPGSTRLRVTNQDHLAHYLEIERLGTKVMYGLDLMPGDTEELKIILEPGRYRFRFPFELEKAGKVELVVTVTPSQAPASPY
jgi:hypothetical protein